MTDQQVPQKTTPVSEAELTAAFIDGAKRLWDITLTKPQLSVLVGHVNLETGSSGAGWSGSGVGNASMHNYNIGNIQWTPGCGRDYYVGGDRTRDANGNWVPTHYKFRAYPSLASAVDEYLRNIHARGGGSVWRAIMQADPEQFAHALKQTHYYEADESEYAAGMNARVKAFNNRPSYENALAGNFPQPTQQSHTTSIDDLLNQLLSALSSNQSRYLKKKAIKQLLPNDYLIKVKTANITNAIEFARILCTAIDEEMLEEAVIHTNGYQVEVQTTIHGSKPLCTEAVLELSDALANAFEKHADVKIAICPNKHSTYDELGISTAVQHYDLFHAGK
jgi:hypothetical protein